MRRTVTQFFSFVLLATLSVGLVGCDETPTSVDDIEVQPNVETPSTLNLVLTEGTVSFDVNYQGLDEHPQVETTGSLVAENASQSGTPRNGEQQWSLSYDGTLEQPVTEQAVVQSTRNGRDVVDTVDVTVSRFLVSDSFTNDFAVVADYEDEQRSFSAARGTTAELDSAVVATNSSGVASLRVESDASGSATVERRTSAPGADRFTFLIHPDPNTDFTLTLAFTEETESGTTTHTVDVPISAGDQWMKYEIGFGQIGADFNPVAARAGGNGPFQSVEMTTDQSVTFHVDELTFATPDVSVADIHDFERTTLAYGPPFCPPSFSDSDMVAEQSDGFTAREVEGDGCFGYNYNNLKAQLSADGVVSFRVNASEGDELFIALETNDGAGGFVYDNGTTVTLPSDGWQVVEIPVTEFGDDPNALHTAGLNNVGFEATQGSESSFLIDDVQLREPAE